MVRRAAMIWLVVLLLGTWAGLATGAFIRSGVTADGKSRAPALSTDKDGRVHLMWVDTRNGSPGVFFNRSDDGGSTWPGADRQVYLSPSPESQIYELEVWADGQGSVYAVWRVRHPGDWIWFAASRDFGATWKPAVRISSSGVSFLPHLSADRAGRVYVVWHEQLGFARGDERFEVRFNSSLDRGETWLPRDVRLDADGPPGTAALPQLVSDDDGHVYVVWRGEHQGSQAVMYIASADAGKTWSRPVKLSQSDHDTEVPKVATDGAGHVYVTWMDWSHGGRPDIYFTASADHGKSWLPKDIRLNTNLPGSAEAFDPQLRVTRQGHVYVAWMDRRNGPPNVYFTASADHGKTWRAENLRLDTLPADQSSARLPRLAADQEGRVWAVWTDIGAQTRLFYSVSTDFGKTWLPREVPLLPLEPTSVMHAPSLGVLPGGKLAGAWEERQPLKPFTAFAGAFNPASLPTDVVVRFLSPSTSESPR